MESEHLALGFETVASRREDLQRRARWLGAFSIGLGLVKLAAPIQLTSVLGLRNSASTRRVVAGLGLGEIATGICLLALSRDGTAQKLVQPIHVVSSITINRPPETIYHFWRDLANLPRFMAHLESVTVQNGTSTWRAKAPAGMTVEWQAEVTLDRPNQAIAWRSLEGASIPNRGVVRFTPAPGGRGTEVMVELKYDPPGGELTAALAKLFGEEPGQQIAGDLRRLKQVLETGDLVHSDASIHRGMHAARPADVDEKTVILGHEVQS